MEEHRSHCWAQLGEAHGNDGMRVKCVFVDWMKRGGEGLSCVELAELEKPPQIDGAFVLVEKWADLEVVEVLKRSFAVVNGI